MTLIMSASNRALILDKDEAKFVVNILQWGQLVTKVRNLCECYVDEMHY